MPNFGDDIDIGVFIGNLLKTLPKIQEVDARIVMQDQYEYQFGIFNHGAASSRPFSSVAMFPSENYTERSAYYDALTEYAEGNYREIWGLDIQQFLDQPQYIVKMMREITNNVMQKKIQAIGDVRNQVEGEFGNKKGKK